jgi:hypothetical protein
MDYKFITLLFLLVALIFLVVREMNNIKENMSTYYEKTKLMIGLSSKENEQKMKSGFNSCIDRIKLINGDYMVQIRKMSDLGKDKIVSTPSHIYTDTDHDNYEGDRKMLPYLSDAVNSRLDNKSDLKHNEKNEPNKDFMIDFSKVKNDIVKVDSQNKSEQKESKRKSGTSTPQNLNTSKSNEDTCSDDDDDDSYNTSDYSTDEETNGSYESDNSSEYADSENGTTMDLEDDVEFENSSENSTRSCSESNKSITTVSSKIEHDIRDNESTGYAESTVTTDMHVTYNTLENIEKYNKKDLDKIAKNIGVPLTYKDQNTGKRPNYGKNDLYDLIKEKLQQKENLQQK